MYIKAVNPNDPTQLVFVEGERVRLEEVGSGYRIHVTGYRDMDWSIPMDPEIEVYIMNERGDTIDKVSGGTLSVKQVSQG